MTKLLRLALGLLAVLICGCVAHAPKPRDRGYAPLVLISIDGYRADYFGRGLSPNLSALAADGVRAEALKPAFPTLTFPNHYTIVTGLYPDHHGIVANRMVDPNSGKRFIHSDPDLRVDPMWWNGEPLWVGVERRGKHAATMFWPGADAAIDGVRPEYWKPFDHSVSPGARVDQVLAWLDLPAQQRPDFVALYFEQVDAAGHDYGPDSPELAAAMREVDAALGRLREGLRRRALQDSANVVVVSDHGMANVDDAHTVLLDQSIDPNAIDLVASTVMAEINPVRGREADVQRALLAPHEHFQCWRKTQMPARWHYGENPRVPAIVCVAASGWMIDTQANRERNHHAVHGEHGYDNDDPKMRALFVAHGPAFRRGLVVPEFDNVDVYPLLTRILHIDPAPNDGDFRVVAPMLTPDYRREQTPQR